MNAGLEIGVMWRHFGVCAPQSTKFSQFSDKYSSWKDPIVSVKTSGLLNGSSFRYYIPDILTFPAISTFQMPINY